MCQIVKFAALHIARRWHDDGDEYFNGDENDDLDVLVVIAVVEVMMMMMMMIMMMMEIDHHLNVFLLVLPLVKSSC